MFFAMQGLQDDQWFDEAGSRQWSSYRDVRRELVDRQIAVSVIQAINRIRCRRVIDNRGNCEQADVYIVLPHDATGDKLLEATKQEMPGIKVADWPLELDGRHDAGASARRVSHMEALVTFMENALPGVYAATHLQKVLKIARSSWADVKSRLCETGSPFAARLAAAGVSVQVETTRNGYEKLALVKA